MKDSVLKWCLLLAVCGNPWIGMSQTNEIDSLLAVLKVSRPDTNRIKTLIQLSPKLCQARRFSEAVMYAREADSLSILFSFLQGRSDANNSIGCTCFKQKQYEEARQYYENSLTHATDAGYKPGIARSNLNLGLLESQLGNDSQAMIHFTTSLAMCTELSDKNGMAGNMNSIANIYKKRKEYENAFNLYNEALAIFEQLGDIEGAYMIYVNLGKMYNQEQKFSQSLTYFSKGLELMKQLGDSSRIGGLYFSMGNAHFNLGNLNEAFHHFQEVLIYEKQLDKKLQIDTYRRIGEINSEQGSFDAAIIQFSKTLQICKESNDLETTAKVYNSMGLLFEKKGDYQGAVEAWVKALKIAEKSGNANDVSTISYNLGYVYELTGQNEEARIHYLKCLEMAQQQEDIIGIVVSTNSLANMSFKFEKYEESLQYILKSIQLCEEHGYKRELLFAYGIVGQVYIEIGNQEKALHFLNKAMQLAEESGEKQALANCHSVLGEMYMLSGEFLLADSYLKKSLSLTAALDNKLDIAIAYKLLGKLDSLRQDYKSAYYHGQMEILYRDSARSETNLKQIAEIKEKYESEKKDKEIIRLESDKHINLLLLQTKSDSLIIAAAERHRFKLEKDRMYALNLASQNKLDLLSMEGKLQALEIEKKNADYITEKIENDKNKSDLAMMSQQARIKELELKRSQLVKNVLLGGLVLFGLLGWFAYSNYSTKQQLKLQKLRNKIASDLHDDVGSTLSSISIFSDMVKLQSKEVNPLLETIGESSKKMLDAMGDIVWTINPENDDFEKILTRMRSFAYELLDAKKIDFAFDADERLHELKVPMEVRKNLYLIFKEATNNLVKYSEADLAQFTIKEENKELTMIIRDNGKGFEENSNGQGNGLKNMKKRAEEIGGKLYIESKRSKGTLIRLSVAV